uniref:Interferon/interleukin receptor domain-containing protein n=2 Tax=Cebus imitator TaxID=2715852 RepID=A0A2K5QLY6_CEBIM
TLFPVTPHGQPVQITLQPAASERHCLSARTIYTFSVLKYSEFSQPACFLLEVPETNWVFLVLPSLLLLLLAIATGGVIWKSLMGNPWFQQAKMPRALV